MLRFHKPKAAKDDIYALSALTIIKADDYNESLKLHTRTTDTGEAQAPKM